MRSAEVSRYPLYVMLGNEVLVYGTIAICSTSDRTVTLMLMQVAKTAQIISTFFIIHTVLQDDTLQD